jgi:uncharacterized membrane protein YhaH (DUF805 family)
VESRNHIQKTGRILKSQTSKEKGVTMNWYLYVLSHYADFTGRARRKEYWMFVLFNIIFAVIAGILDSILGIAKLGIGPICMLYILAMFIPSLSVGVRRLHDVGKSGWMMLIAFIPIIGAIWLLVLMLLNSQIGENQYGPNPKLVP